MTTAEAFRKHPILFMMGSLLTFTLVFLVMMGMGMLVGLPPVDIGKGMAGVVLVTVIPGGASFVRFVKKERADGSRVELNTPRKRAILLLAPVGFIFIVLSYFVWGYSFDRWLDVVFTSLRDWAYREGHYLASILLFWFGMTLLFCGLVFSYLYDKTIGKIVGWVKGT
jgi:predicted Na+-dependent transporter